MRRLSFFLLSIFLVFTNINSSYAFDNKNCNKINFIKSINNKKYICKYVNGSKKYVLLNKKKSDNKFDNKPLLETVIPNIEDKSNKNNDNGPVIDISKPSPQVNNNDNRRLTHQERAFQNVLNFYNSKIYNKDPFLIINHPNSNAIESKLLYDISLFSARFWAPVFIPKNNLPLIIGDGKDIDWMQSEMRKYGFELGPWGISSILHHGGFGNLKYNDKGSLFIYTGDPDPNPCIPCKYTFGAHEYTHAVSSTILEHRNSGIPWWSVEGSASYFGYAITKLFILNNKDANQSDYLKTLEIFRSSYLQKEGIIFHHLSKKEIYNKLIESESMDSADNKIAYSGGKFITELLISQYGINNFISWWELSKNKHWIDAFYDIYKVSIDQYYLNEAIPYLQELSKIEYNDNFNVDEVEYNPIQRVDLEFSDPGYKNKINLKAIGSYEEYVNKNPNQYDIKLLANPNLNKNILDDLNLSISGATKGYNSLPNNPIIVFITFSDDYDWYITEYSKLLGKTPVSYNNFLYNNGFLFENFESKYILSIFLSKDKIDSFIYHERWNYFNDKISTLLQSVITNNNRDSMPCWLKLGSLQYYNYLINRHTFGVDAEEFKVNSTISWHFDSSGYNLANLSSSDWINLLNLLSIEGISCPGNYSYMRDIGFIIVEEIIAEFGYSKFIDMISKIQSVNSFNNSFNNTYGIDFTNYYKNIIAIKLYNYYNSYKLPTWAK
jgi:hypothetical protein